MVRTILSTHRWRWLQKLVPSETGHQGQPYAQSHRKTIAGILWIARTRVPWRDLPPCFGPWDSVYKRFHRWTRQGVFPSVFNDLLRDLDLDVVMVDGTFVKVHPHATGGRPQDQAQHEEALGRSRGGLNTKIMVLTDKRGRFVKLRLKPGHAAEAPELADLLDDVPLTETQALLGNKAYDSDGIRELPASRGGIATIPPRAHRRRPAGYDAKSYQGRHLIENGFLDTKQFRGMATRCAKLAILFEGQLHLMVWVVGTRTTRRGASPHHAT